MDRELYLPKPWTSDAERMSEAGVPEGAKFQTKPQLAKQLLERAFEAGVQAKWVTADEVYGRDRRLRVWLESREQPVRARRCKQREAVARRDAASGGAGRFGFSQVTAKKIAAGLEDLSWQRLSAGKGEKGPRLYDWARSLLFRLAEPEWEHWLLVRRNVEDPEDLAYYVVFAPAGTWLAELVGVAGQRWTIEQCFEGAKGEAGLDQYEVRGWEGWYRHITLSLLAHAFLSVTRAAAAEGVKNGAA